MFNMTWDNNTIRSRNSTEETSKKQIKPDKWFMLEGFGREEVWSSKLSDENERAGFEYVMIGLMDSNRILFDAEMKRTHIIKPN